MRTELPDGGWIEHTPVQALKAKDKDAIGRVLAASLPPVADDQMPAIDGAARALMMTLWRDATWARVLTAWSFDDLPLPQIEGEHGGEHITNQESIGELGLDDFDAIADALAPHVAKIMRSPDPKGAQSATTSSSNGSSRARARPSRTG